MLFRSSWQVRFDPQQTRLDTHMAGETGCSAGKTGGSAGKTGKVRRDTHGKVRLDTHGRSSAGKTGHSQQVRHATRSDQQGVVLTPCTLLSHTSRETVAISPQPPVRGKPVHSQVQLHDVQPLSACTCVHRYIPLHGEAVEACSR